MTTKPSLSWLAKELCRREESEGRELNISDAKRAIRNLFYIMVELMEEDEEKVLRFLDKTYKHYRGKRK